ncbi:MAG: VCBS repeat-containing protein [Thermoleophilia bacterium]|nr:VCBS repeat-containing protein [Thermoleophilia bacterium]MDH5314646.1 VCBS repeat-containing protein [Actinomycetota bacterium]
MLHKPQSSSGRRWATSTLVALSLAASFASAPAAARVSPVRDVGEAAGLPTDRPSYGLRAHDFDGDGLKDLLIVHHDGPTELYRNTGSGFELATTFVDSLHGEIDRHDCAWGDVNRDGRDDLYCVKGAQVGRAEKHNELWMQRPDGSFRDLAGIYRVVDRWGRGRRTSFIDLNGDRYPDLFVGNNYPRQDEHPTPNRTYINVDGERFRRVNLGLTREVGTFCVQVTDVDGDGRDDILICEKHRLRLYLRRASGFIDASRRFGIPERAARWARLADLDRDRALDLVVVTNGHLSIRLRSTSRRFAGPVLRRRLELGHGLAIGDIDDRHGPDVLVVEGCVDGVNVDDVLLLNGGNATTWTEHRVPGDVPGCGDVAARIDVDGNGAAEFVVLNGSGQAQPAGIVGPDQLLTMGDWPAP